MSLLVGSGFSKNVDPNFLTWDELLYDLTYELHRFEIDQGFEIQKRKPRAKMGYGEYAKEKVKEILQRKTYLDVVTEYNKKTNLPETIAHYIEERTPNIIVEKENYYLDLKGIRMVLDESNLALHRGMVNLPWNNIFTTNYDELLEKCVDHTLYKQIKEEINVLEIAREDMLVAVKNLSKQLHEIEEEVDRLEAKILPIEGEILIESKIPLLIDTDGSILSKDKKNYDRLRNKQEELAAQLDFKEEEKQLKDREIDLKYKQLENTFCLVIRSKDLQIKKNKNIIKLHGSLRTAEEKSKNVFGFDNDLKKHYIIAKEDYQTYPEDHEAFTQLMRISLLQESFCLIGFSGVDPNFLAWVGWVQDLLKRQSTPNIVEQRQDKIYLIALGSEELTKDKELFYENHSITRVRLTSPEAISFLEDETGEKLEKGLKKDEFYKQSLRLLIKFLSNHSIPFFSHDELNADENRKVAWANSFNFVDTSHNIDVEELDSILTKIETGYSRKLLPPLYQSDTYRQENILAKQEDYIEKNKVNHPDRTQLIKLYLYAINDVLIPLSYGLEETYITEALAIDSLRPIILPMAERQKVLRPLHQDTKEIGHELATYNKVLFLAFSFRYKELKKLLKDWVAEAENVMYKAGFLMLFDLTSAEKELKKLLAHKPEISAERLLYNYELLQYVKLSNRFKRDKELDNTINEYTKLGLKSVTENFETIEKIIKTKQGDSIPYGKTTYIGTHDHRFSSATALAPTLQYLISLINCGFPLNSKGTSFRNHSDWYPVAKIGLKEYPEAFLYYSLQISNKEFLQQIGKDYRNHIEIAPILTKVCENIMQNWVSIPKSYRDNNTIFLTEIIIAVDPEHWKKEFINLWKEAFKTERRFTDNHSPENAFFKKCLRYINSRELILSILNDCLKEQSSMAISIQAINYLNQLTKNKLYRYVITKEQMDPELNTKINLLIEQLPTKFNINLFLLGNISKCLSEQQKAQITEQLISIDPSSANIRTLGLIRYFAGNELTINKKLKKVVLNHPAVWHTGIEGSTIHGGMDFISPVDFTKKNHSGNQIKWTKREVIIFYGKLKTSLSDIKRMSDPTYSIMDIFTNDYVAFLNEATQFLTLFKKSLHTQPDFNEIVLFTQDLTKVKNGYDYLDQGLISSDDTIFLRALHELSQSIYKTRIPINSIRLVLNKIMLQSSPGLETAISYIPLWFDYLVGLQKMKDFVPSLIAILDRYKNYRELDINQPLTLGRLTEIALLLKNIGETHEIVNYWLQLAEQSNYNNVKDFCKYKLNT